MQESEGREDRVEILFLSEGNVCRSIYAEAIFNSLVRQLGVQDELLCTSRVRSRTSTYFRIHQKNDSQKKDSQEDTTLFARSTFRHIVEYCSANIFGYIPASPPSAIPPSPCPAADALCSILQATRDYNVGEAPDSRALQVAQEVQLELPQDHRAALFVPAKDIVIYDLAIVMDKVRPS